MASLERLSPGYGACVMGTGILAIATYVYLWPPIRQLLASFFTILNTVIAAVVAASLLLRIARSPDDISKELFHPVKANFYPTLPIGLMVLGMDYLVVLGKSGIAAALWAAGAASTFILGVLIPYNLFRTEAVRLDHINPSFFIPPVGLIVIPIGGGVFLRWASGTWLYEPLLLLDIVSWGSGFSIYIALLAVCVNRFLLHRPMPGSLAPTMWINLGPIGAGIVALSNIVDNMAGLDHSIAAAASLFKVFFWGSGLWWLLLAILMTTHYVRRGELSYAPSWWAFTFPLGAYCVATSIVYAETHAAIIKHLGLLLYMLLLLLWVAAFQGMIRRLLFAHSDSQS